MPLVTRAIAHPASPAFLAALLLVAGTLVTYATGTSIDDYVSGLAYVGAAVGLMLMIPTRRLGPPVLSARAQVVLRVSSLSALAVELAYFGVPLLGGVAYNEFGWPVIHHLAAAYWLLILFGTRHRMLDFLVTIAIASLLFNRQMALFATLALFMTRPMNTGRFLSFGLLAVAAMAALGALRNSTLGVDTSALDGDVPLSSPLFFIYLYLTGPLNAAFGSNAAWDTQLASYWNTLPEWFLFSKVLGLAPAASFAIFYTSAALLSAVCRRASDWRVKAFGWLIHIYAFFSFFSNVLIGTPIIASFAIIAMVSSLYPRRATAR